MISKLSLFVASASSAAVWNYATNGADWPSLSATDVPDNLCGSTNQSPIDLISYNPDKKEDFPYKRYPATEDQYRKSYSNQFASALAFNGHTTQLDLDPNDGVNTFNSKMGEKLFGSVKEFNGVQFHFHAGSEHTIDGKRHDFEMHTVHLTQESAATTPVAFADQAGGVGAAAVGIMFSVNDYTANLTWAEQQVIDTFFDSLKLDDLGTETSAGSGKYSHNIDMALYGNLMQMVDNGNRWVYKGSVTTPPCATYVYWNVMSTIYPISQRHLDLFKAQLNLGEGGQLDERGNWRAIQTVDKHEVAYIMTGGVEDTVPMYKGLMAGIVVLAIISFILLIITTVLCMKKPTRKEEVEMQKSQAAEE